MPHQAVNPKPVDTNGTMLPRLVTSAAPSGRWNWKEGLLLQLLKGSQVSSESFVVLSLRTVSVEIPHSAKPNACPQSVLSGRSLCDKDPEAIAGHMS